MLNLTRINQRLQLIRQSYFHRESQEEQYGCEQDCFVKANMAYCATMDSVYANSLRRKRMMPIKNPYFKQAWKSTMLILIATMAFASAPSNAASDIGSSGRLVLAQGGAVLNVYFNGQYEQLKRARTFYGYGWIDKNRVFIAYQEEDTPEAVAILEVFDLSTKKVAKLIDIGGVGESNFDVNSSTGEIVFCDADGISLLKISAKNTYQRQKLKKGDKFWGTFWVDENTVGTFVYGKDKSDFLKFPVKQGAEKRGLP
jgi:hypothetical protein